VGRGRAEGKVRDEEGVAVKDGEGGEKGVWDVKGGSDEEDFEGGRGRGDECDGIGFVKAVITVFWMYSKAWVGPCGKGRVRGK